MLHVCHPDVFACETCATQLSLTVNTLSFNGAAPAVQQMRAPAAQMMDIDGLKSQAKAVSSAPRTMRPWRCRLQLPLESHARN